MLSLIPSARENHYQRSSGIPKDIPIVSSVQAALAYHPDVLLIGIAPSGGILPDAWLEEVKQGVKGWFIRCQWFTYALSTLF